MRIHLLRAAPEVQRAIFQRLLSAGSEEVGGFLEYFQDKTGQFDPNTLGCYLCAFELKTANPPANFVVDLLSGSDPRATTSFLMSLANYNGRIPNPGRIFRLLLRLPYVDQDTETHTGDLHRQDRGGNPFPLPSAGQRVRVHHLGQPGGRVRQDQETAHLAQGAQGEGSPAGRDPGQAAGAVRLLPSCWPTRSPISGATAASTPPP